MKEKGKQFLWVHTLLFLLTGFGIRLLLKRFFPSYAIGSYFLIPTFFYLFGLGSFQSFLRIRMKSGKTIVHTYMILRTVKIVLSLLMVITYWLIDKPLPKIGRASCRERV